MQKILVYILSEAKGGVEEYALNLSRYSKKPSSKYGYLIMGETSIYEEELKDLGVDYYYIPSKSKLLSNIKTYNDLLKTLRKEYSAIYYNTSGLYYPIPYILGIMNRYKIVLHSHSTKTPHVKSILHKINRLWINKFVSIRMACSTPAGKWMFGDSSEFTLIPNAVDTKRFEYDEASRKACRDRLQIGNEFVMGNVSRLHHLKNHLFLIDILYEVIKRKEEVKLLLVGDGEMRNEIFDKAKRLGIQNNVIFAGETNTPEQFFSAMDCFVMPSIVEGFPITLIEAQANGLPCVVSDTITEETNVTGHISFCSLKSCPADWAGQIIQAGPRYEGKKLIQDAGFDVLKLEDKVYTLISK